ncbi:MAG: DNA polymerase III subunit delta [Rhodospirillales bacterium]|nr:DNA polymerase III subunit delta [Rhodospirillales bacterium]
MKFAGARAAAFLKNPDPGVRAVLLFGPDAGLVRERADILTRHVCPDLADPFRIAEITGSAAVSDPARLADEMAAISLMGGRRVIRLRDAGDGAAAAVGNALAAPGDALLVAEAGDLPVRSALRKLFESRDDAAAIGCYPDTPRDLADVIRTGLGERRITVTGEALVYLVDRLGGDRLVTRSELEKLALYVGDGGRVDLAAAKISVGDSADLSLDDIVYAAAEGDAAALERALFRSFAEGENPVRILRAVQRHFQMLHLADGRPEAVRAPPLPSLRERLGRQVRRWPAARAAAALDALTEAELTAKRTGAPQEAICRRVLLALARPDLG